MTFKYYLTLIMPLLGGQVLAQDIAEKKENIHPNVLTRSLKEAPRYDDAAKQRSSLRLQCELKDHHLAKLQLPFKSVTLRVVGTYNTQLSDKWHIPLISGKLINPSQLQELTIFSSGLNDKHIAGITDFIHLRTLIIDTNIITDGGAKLIAQLSELRKLDLQHNDVGDEGLGAIAQLPRLQYLDVTCNEKITDSGLRQFINHSTIQTLKVKHTSVSREMYLELKEHINEVEYF